MRELGLHQLLDVAEYMLEENLDSKQLARVRRDLYRPEPDATDAPGFGAREEMAGFRALQARFARKA
ncbi:hypothetical protein [Nocardia otitidiscaviarum]|uniref:hypothetical protein n=1 Tax=Nocardia otitidiscaviarum TaxID=1823 RepID=UPI003F731DE0